MSSITFCGPGKIWNLLTFLHVLHLFLSRLAFFDVTTLSVSVSNSFTSSAFCCWLVTTVILSSCSESCCRGDRVALLKRVRQIGVSSIGSTLLWWWIFSLSLYNSCCNGCLNPLLDPKFCWKNWLVVLGAVLKWNPSGVTSLWIVDFSEFCAKLPFL